MALKGMSIYIYIYIYIVMGSKDGDGKRGMVRYVSFLRLPGVLLTM